MAAVVAERRGTVRLELPAAAAGLGYLPWELARVSGRTLAAHRVSFVIDQLPHRPMAKNPVGERMRMLAVFSLPEGAGALNLRRERHALTELVREIAKVNGKAIDLRVLQYGATRRRLEDALLERPGWDVIHLSGHGLAGGLVLEDDAGRRDVIDSTELVDVLDLGSDQIKLVTLSACESAAVTAKEHLHQLGLDLTPGTTRDNRPGRRTAARGGGGVGGAVGLRGAGDALPGGRRLRDRPGGRVLRAAAGARPVGGRCAGVDAAADHRHGERGHARRCRWARRCCSGPAPPS